MAAVKDDLRTWVADNIILGNNPQQLIDKLIQLGYPPEDANAEISDALSHPYIASGFKFYTILQRREALLKTLDMQRRQLKDYLSIEKTPLPPYQSFLSDYYFQNRPGIFTGAVDHWEARNWTFENLVEKVGADTAVEIQFDREKDANYESNSTKHRRQIEFGSFIEMIQSVDSSNNFYLTANNAAFANSKMRALADDIGNIGDGYLDPERIGQDTHLWIGPKGTITPAHHDLTNNLFVQIYGSKKFKMVPAFQVPYLYNDLHVFSRADLLKLDFKRFPNIRHATIVEFDVEAGDMLFIPIGWWHHVVSQSANVSISFTNFNLVNNRFIDFPGSDGRY